MQKQHKSMIKRKNYVIDNPKLATEWDYEKNGEITPDMVTAHSNKKYYWKCTKGHSWIAAVNNRTKGSGCPYCSGRLAIVGKTDLSTVNPQLASEWDYERNGGITPDMVTAHSGKKYFWKCEKGHSWMASPNNRSKGNDCPYCAGRYPIVGISDLKTLKPELAAEWDYERNEGVTPEMVALYSSKKYYWRCENGHSWISSVTDRSSGNDCPYCSGRLAITGETDLSTVNPQLASEWDYERNGEITPNIVTPHSGKKYFWKCEKGHSWEATVADRSYGTSCPYCSGRLVITGETDLKTLRPELAAEWDYERNEGVTPEMVALHSNKKYYWRCEKRHSWMASPNNRANGRGCPYCDGKLPIVGESDLASKNSQLASEWNYERNGGVTPDMVTVYSNKKYFWKCKNGHSWMASPNSRSKGSGCPYCK